MGFGSVLFLIGMIGGSLAGETTGFVRGHIFVAISRSEPCDFGGREWIVEIDPDSGAWSIFADSDDGLCVVTGLRFTPDGSRLLAASGGHISPVFDGGWIQAFNPDGSSEIILDASDGLFAPVGSNCLAFDRVGDLYVVSAENSRILRFPHDGSPATVFADSGDGIDGRGSLDFSPSGDLFYATNFGGVTLRINPAGQASVFERPGGFTTIAIDVRGNLFAAGGSTVFRYDGPDPDPRTRRLLTNEFNSCCDAAIALSPDGQTVYFAGTPGRVYAIDPDTGASSLIADFGELLADGGGGGGPTGATVYAPDPDQIPGRCCFALHTPSPGCIDGVTRPQYGDDEPGPFLFTPKENCTTEGADCETITGACCDNNTFGSCTDDTFITQCDCATCNWRESQTCTDIECPATSIPAASAWGLTAMSLSLMIGAKIVFGHGVGTGAKCATV